MREIPILFSGPMVRALLDGTKTQTRRVVKLPSGHHWASGDASTGIIVHTGRNNEFGTEFSVDELRCPYGQPGDRLWVRENGWQRPERTPRMMREGADTWEPYYFDADGLSEQESADFKAWGFKRRPSIHMPRWASRITLEVTGVRVERLQEIDKADAQAEGCDHDDPCDHVRQACADIGCPGPDYRIGYRNLWEQINGPGSWDANPWVWCVSFRRVEPC